MRETKGLTLPSIQCGFVMFCIALHCTVANCIQLPAVGCDATTSLMHSLMQLVAFGVGMHV
jgi:hypothetical protein